MLLGLFLWHVIHGVCTTRHWQTPGRLVQELNVCTVLHPDYCYWQLSKSLLNLRYGDICLFNSIKIKPFPKYVVSLLTIFIYMKGTSSYLIKWSQSQIQKINNRTYTLVRTIIFTVLTGLSLFRKWFRFRLITEKCHRDATNNSPSNILWRHS